MATFRTLLPHKAGTTIEVFGEHFTFDEAGFGTLTTDREDVIARLRNIPEGFSEADGPVEDDEDEGSTPDVSAFVLKGEDGATLDLATLDDAKLAEFAKANDLKVHHKTLAAGGDKLRAAIVKALA
jgi:hypothetical protein